MIQFLLTIASFFVPIIGDATQEAATDVRGQPPAFQIEERVPFEGSVPFVVTERFDWSTVDEITATEIAVTDAGELLVMCSDDDDRRWITIFNPVDGRLRYIPLDTRFIDNWYMIQERVTSLGALVLEAETWFLQDASPEVSAVAARGPWRAEDGRLRPVFPPTADYLIQSDEIFTAATPDGRTVVAPIETDRGPEAVVSSPAGVARVPILGEIVEAADNPVLLLETDNEWSLVRVSPDGGREQLASFSLFQDGNLARSIPGGYVAAMEVTPDGRPVVTRHDRSGRIVARAIVGGPGDNVVELEYSPELGTVCVELYGADDEFVMSQFVIASFAERPIDPERHAAFQVPGFCDTLTYAPGVGGEEAAPVALVDGRRLIALTRRGPRTLLEFRPGRPPLVGVPG